MFTGASNLAEGVDRTFIFIFSIAAIFIVGITVFMIYTVVHFSRKKGKEARQFRGNAKLEALWITVPIIIVMVMFYFGWSGFAPMRDVPADAMEITAIGRMWEWEFDYGNGMKSKELVVPVNKAVRVNLKSEDVNHSLFIPAFRVKEDAIPGYSNYLWFIPTIVGEYEILCTEYCGLLHSSMLSKARVLEQEKYDVWFSEFKNTASEPVPDGYLLLRNTGCIACHSLDGTRLVGPSFKNLFGKETTVMEGTTQKSITVNEDYIKNSIYNPDSEIVTGYNKGLMRSYKDVINENDIQIIIDYLKTLAGEK
jgi:cytochrome c oxidase subunit II